MEKNREIEISGRKISYLLRRNRRARCLRLSMRRDASLAVTLPWRCAEAAAGEFIRKNYHWILEKAAYFEKNKSVLPKPTREDYLKYKEVAREIAEKKLAYFNVDYSFSWKKISIRNPRTRWGSCSGNGNLNFSYRIIYLPEKLCDYVIVHELCHLGEFNHSKNFWALVKKTIPDYRERRRKVRVA